MRRLEARGYLTHYLDGKIFVYEAGDPGAARLPPAPCGRSSTASGRARWSSSWSAWWTRRCSRRGRDSESRAQSEEASVGRTSPGPPEGFHGDQRRSARFLWSVLLEARLAPRVCRGGARGPGARCHQDPRAGGPSRGVGVDHSRDGAGDAAPAACDARGASRSLTLRRFVAGAIASRRRSPRSPMRLSLRRPRVAPLPSAFRVAGHSG